MNLLWPAALLGLLAVPVILLLHLLRNRREQLDIPSLRLWLGLERKKHGTLPRHIPLSLMLFLQLFIAVALTLALARPALSLLLARPQHTIFILDMTTSMTAEDVPIDDSAGSFRRFDAARQLIQTHLETLGADDTFAIISLDPRPQILLTGNSQHKMQAQLALDNLVPGATGVNLPAALTLANGLINDPDREHKIIVLTDGNFTLPPGSLPPMLAPVDWKIFPDRLEEVSNQALLNVSAATWPDGRHRLFARVINYGETPTSRTLRITTDQGNFFTEEMVSLDPQAETARVWTLPAQAETAMVEIVEPDILSLDNRAELLLSRPTRHRVLLLSDTPEILARALEAQPGVELTIDNSLEMIEREPTTFDLVVLDGLPSELTTWPSGNVLVVNPPLGHPLVSAENFARNLRPDPDTGSALLAGVDLSGVYFNRAPRLTLPDWAEVDLMGASRSETPALLTPLIFHGAEADSRLVVWAFDLAESNLPARLALPILTANTLTTLLAPSPPPVVPVGEPVLIDGNYSIEIPGGRRLSSTHESPLRGVYSYTKQPGLYRIYNEENVPVAGFAVHAGSALESNLVDSLEPDLLDLSFVPQQTAVTAQIDFQEFWPWLTGLALLIVVAEGWLAWRR